MGYDETLFESQPVCDGFKCPICHDVLQDPLTVDSCEHLFCSQCIRESLQSSSRCPVCRGSISEQSLRPALRQFCSLMQSLRVRCPFEECTMVVELNQWERHQLNCSENPMARVNRRVERVFCTQFCGAELHYDDDDNEYSHDCRTFMVDIIHRLTLDKTELIERIRQLELNILQSTLSVQMNSNENVNEPLPSAPFINPVAPSVSHPMPTVSKSNTTGQLYPELPVSVTPISSQNQATHLSKKSSFWKFWK